MKKKYRDKLIFDELKIMDEIDRICVKNNIIYFLTAGSLLGAVRHGGIIPWDDDIDIAMPREDFDKFVEICNVELNKDFFLDYYTINKKYIKSFAKLRLKETKFIENGAQNLSNWAIWIDIFPLDNISENNINKSNFNKKIINKLDNILIKKYRTNFSELRNFKSKFLYVISKIIPIRLVTEVRNIFMRRFNNINNKYYINYGSQYSVNKQIHLKEQYYPVRRISFEGKEYNAPNNIDYVLTKIYGNNYMELPPAEKRVTHDPIYIKFSDGTEVDFVKERDGKNE